MLLADGMLKPFSRRSLSAIPAIPFYDMIRCEKLFNVRLKADKSQLNLPHGTED